MFRKSSPANIVIIQSAFVRILMKAIHPHSNEKLPYQEIILTRLMPHIPKKTHLNVFEPGCGRYLGNYLLLKAYCHQFNIKLTYHALDYNSNDIDSWKRAKKILRSDDLYLYCNDIADRSEE